MELQAILEYSKNNWEKIKEKIESQGHPAAFYFILLPEYADHRFIDPTLPAIGTSTYGVSRANIINPGMGEFYGIKLDERVLTEEGYTPRIENMKYVDVSFLKGDEIYGIICQKETIPQNQRLTKYTAWGGYVAITPDYLASHPESLHKVYMELKDLIKSE